MFTKQQWTTIKNSYPKAHKEFGEWMDLPSRLFSMFKLRDLYDFFDEKCIYVTVDYQPSEQTWNTKIYKSGDNKRNYSSGHRDRDAAELCIFKEAFRILQEKLEGEK